MKNLIICVFGLLALTGCSNEGAENQTTNEKTVIDAQLKALEKAHNVESILKESEERTREAIEAQ